MSRLFRSSFNDEIDKIVQRDFLNFFFSNDIILEISVDVYVQFSFVTARISSVDTSIRDTSKLFSLEEVRTFPSRLRILRYFREVN